MNRKARWAAATCTALVCVVAMAFAFAPVKPQSPSGAAPMPEIADPLLPGEGAGEAEARAVVEDGTQDAASAESEEVTGYEQGAVLVSLRDGVNLDAARDAIARETGLQDVSVEEVADSVAKVRFGGNVSVPAAAKAMLNSDAVAMAQPNFVYRPEAGSASGGQASGKAGNRAAGLAAPDGLDLLQPQAAKINDPKATTWMLESVNAYKAWDVVAKAKKKNAVTVAVLDQGINLDHEDLDGKFVYNASSGKYDKPLFVAPFNAFTNKAGAKNITASDSHGTHVAGIIAAHVNNGKGVAGITNNMVQVMPVQILDTTGKKTYTDRVVRGVRYVIKNAKKYNVRVMNMSFGGGVKSDDWKYGDLLLMDSLADAFDADILPVTSAGNVDSDKPKEPEGKAPYFHVPGDLAQTVSTINLCNTDKDDPKMVNRYATSNYNVSTQMAKDISAPGTDITSTAVGGKGKYITYSGTSMAAPVVSSVAALMFVLDGKLSADEAASKLYSSVMSLYSKENKLGDPIWSAEFGYGEVDAYASVDDGEYLSGPITVFTGEKKTYKLHLPSGVKASAKDVKWSIYKTTGGTVAACDDNGMSAVVTGKKAGSFVLLAQVKVGKRLYRAAQTVTVFEPEVNGSKNLMLGESETFFSSQAPAGMNRTWTWTSSKPAVASVSKDGKVTAKDLGTTTITVTLKSNPKVKASKKVTVKPVDLADTDDLDISYRIPTYTGKPLKPKFNIAWNEGKSNEIKLVEGKDYKITFQQNVNSGKKAGKAKIIALKGSKYFTGSRAFTFTIKDAPIGKAKVTGVKNLKFTGKPVSQNPTVTLDKTKLKVKTDYAISYLNAQKKAIKSDDVKARGTYYLVVTGKGNYTGKVQVAFKVV